MKLITSYSQINEYWYLCKNKRSKIFNGLLSGPKNQMLTGK